MLKNIKQRKESGFTIIEVLIVLAIAGLIMVIVFLAVPALQRSSRNNSRKTEANNIASAVSEVVANKGGTAPAASDLGTITGNTKLSIYTAGNISLKTDLTTKPTTSTVVIIPNYTCGSDPTADPVAQNRATAIWYAVETGGGGTTGQQQCVSS